MSVNRGTFLAGAASAFALRPSASRAPRIVIVGGGVAGCTCAYRLQQSGIASTLYEASDRIGGRTWTLRDYFAGGADRGARRRVHLPRPAPRATPRAQSLGCTS